MRIGVAKEIKPQEYRVALTPAGARELVQLGHEVVVETGAGTGSQFPDADYEANGARVGSVDEVWETAELLLKVKEPIAPEYPRLRDGLVLFTYLHIAADEPLTRALVESGITAVAYETVETEDGRLPLLAPMSEVAGRLAAQAGAYFLEKPLGGRGLLLAGIPGVAPGREVQEKVVRAIETSISKIARPKAVRIVPDMPKTRSGKIMRRILAAISNTMDTGDTTTTPAPTP